MPIEKTEQDDADQSGITPDTGGGEDDSSTEIEGDDSHLHEDQKSRRLKT
jgi:hypothetical protein